MKKTDFESLKSNIYEDLEKCSNRELKEIYSTMKECLKIFDRDELSKNIIDFFKIVFKTKKEKCKYFIEDIVESKDKLTDAEKEQLRKMFLDISNIKRTFKENIISLLEAL